MKLARDLAVIGITALLAAPFARLHAAHADGDELPLAPRPASLDLDGVTVTITGHAAKAGFDAVGTLAAVNRRDVPVERTVAVHLAVTPFEPMSRMGPRSRVKWTREVTLRLAAGETRKIGLETAVKLAEGEIASFQVGPEAERRVLAVLAAATQTTP